VTTKRKTQPGAVYHFIARFVDSRWLIDSEHERRVYLQLLGEGLAKSDWRCFGYAIMSNHIHLALVAGEMKLASWLREVHRQFAQWTNARRDRIGAVFVRGPAMHWMRPEAAGRLLSYIHYNPVRAGVVGNPGDCDWTSHRTYVGTEEARPWLDTELGLELCGVRDGGELAALFAGAERVCKAELEAARLDRRRRGRPPRRSVPPDAECVEDAGGGGSPATRTTACSWDVELGPGGPQGLALRAHESGEGPAEETCVEFGAGRLQARESGESPAEETCVELGAGRLPNGGVAPMARLREEIGRLSRSGP
jgi:REP element-mobilizing transposase RayT